ncbi:hypothetical protein Tco_1579135 [Tanacetum coccineum]
MDTIHVTFDELHQTMAPVHIRSGPEPIMMSAQISSNLVSQMSQRRLLASLQAPFLKDKKGVRFSALYLQQKRNIFVLHHFIFFHARSVVKWINVDQLMLQKNPIFHISVDISRTQTSLGHSLHQQIPFYLHSAVLEYSDS